MTDDAATRIAEAAIEVDSAFHRLVLIVGRANSGKTAALLDISKEQGWPRINVNLALSERLLELTQPQRARKASGIMDDLVRESASNTIILDNLEILFGADLQQDPLRLLYRVSRNHTIIAAWPGHVENSHLIYAEPAHPEYRREAKPEAVLVMFDEEPRIATDSSYQTEG